MTASELAAQLREWSTEYGTIAEPVVAPNGFWTFLANRLCECSAVEPDPDTVTIRTFDGTRKVRITGTHGARLAYEPADGSRGFGIVEMKDILDDRGRVDAILERLVKAGKVKEG